MSFVAGTGQASAAPIAIRASQLAERLSPLAITAESPQSEWPGKPDSVVLTGATGFLGAFILWELLDQTETQVSCLIRAPDPAAARARLFDTMARYELDRDDLAGRVREIPADLSRTRLGLTVADYEALARETDAIYHNAAAVNWLATYEDLEPANVAGTRQVLELAAHRRPTPVHHVSSVGVFAYRGGRTIDEDRSIDHDEPLVGGYVQTKWAAEKLASLAGEAGLPVRIYRPGTLVGSSQTGHFSAASFLDRVIAASAGLGLTPTLAPEIEMTPVDYAARTLVALSLQQDFAGRVAHLTNPAPPHRKDLARALTGLGYPVEAVPYEQWRDALFNSPEFERSPLRPFRRFLAAVSADALTTPRYGSARTQRALGSTGVRCPPVDSALLGTYIARYAEAGLLAARPARSPTTAAVAVSERSQ